jgi:hypothetical protein
MKYCQGPSCHEYKTKDRIRGPKGSKRYETRRRSQFYYGKGNFCDQRCMYDWISKHIEHGLDHFGRTTQAKYVMTDNAWYKDYKYNYSGDRLRDTNTYFFINDLLGQRIPITEQQYQDENLTTPTTS